MTPSDFIVAFNALADHMGRMAAWQRLAAEHPGVAQEVGDLADASVSPNRPNRHRPRRRRVARARF